MELYVKVKGKGALQFVPSPVLQDLGGTEGVLLY